MTISCSYAEGDSTTHALCQGCLRLHEWSALVPDDNNPPGLCPACGVEACHCGFCMSTAQLLAAGDFLNPEIGLQRPHEILSWTPEGGAVKR